MREEVRKESSQGNDINKWLLFRSVPGIKKWQVGMTGLESKGTADLVSCAEFWGAGWEHCVSEGILYELPCEQAQLICLPSGLPALVWKLLLCVHSLLHTHLSPAQCTLDFAAPIPGCLLLLATDLHTTPPHMLASADATFKLWPPSALSCEGWKVSRWVMRVILTTAFQLRDGSVGWDSLVGFPRRTSSRRPGKPHKGLWRP